MLGAGKAMWGIIKKNENTSGNRVPRPSLHIVSGSFQLGDDSGQIFDHCLTKLVRPRPQELETN